MVHTKVSWSEGPTKIHQEYPEIEDHGVLILGRNHWFLTKASASFDFELEATKATAN